MKSVRNGARWYLRVALSLVLLFDVAVVAGMLCLSDIDGPRVLLDAPPVLRALAGHPERVLPIAAIALVALARFASGPGHVGAALGVLATTGFLCEARAAHVGGPERFLFVGGTVLVGWIAGLAFVRLGRGDRDAEEAGAEIGAIAALAAIYVNAALQKVMAAGITWADGDSLRLLVLSQRPFDAGFPTATIADVVTGHRSVAFALAAFVELAQLSAIVYPFHPRARAVVGTMLLAFHAGVRMLTPISFPQSMALLVIFSFPWGRWLERRGWVAPDPPDRVLARRPARAAAGIALATGLLVLLAFVPPVRRLIDSLAHLDVQGRAQPDAHRPQEREPARDAFDDAAGAALSLQEGQRVGPCVAVGASRRGVEIAARFACDGAPLVVDVVPAGTRPFEPPRSAGGRDLFYRSASRGHEEPELDAATRDALLEALARHLEASSR